MVRAVEQIEQEIAALDQTVAAIAQAFYNAYQQYLTGLGQAIRQQLVLAGYHICTHGYPEQFLNLSLNQRQELQQSLRQLTKQSQIQLLECLQPITPIASVSEKLDEEPIADLDSADEALNEAFQEAFQLGEFQSKTVEFSIELSELQSDEPEPQAIEVSDTEESDTEESDTEESDTEAEELDEVLPLANLETETAAQATQLNRPLQPKDIARWQAVLEDKIAEVLQDLSHAANRALQQAEILPNRLPEPVLEVAAKADLSSEVATSPPNLLNLLIETDDENEKPSMTQVIAIRLRLAEIEFSDSVTAANRSKLRQLMAQLTKLGREYQRKQKERSVVQAEAAWRSSWYEGED